MQISAIATFWVVSLLFVLTPGADWAFAITAGMRSRVRPAVSGLLAGHLIATLVVAAGVGAVVSRLPLILVALTMVGSLYLVWLGVGVLTRPPVPGAQRLAFADSSSRWLLKGLGVSGLNPKVFLLFLALLPQFTDADQQWPVALQIASLGLVHILSCAVVYTAVALTARRVLTARPAAARGVSRVSGAAMIAIGLFLLVEQLIQLWAPQ